MKLRNFTPHEVVLLLADGTELRFPTEGSARVAVLPEQPETIEGLPVLPPVQYGEVSGLPEPEQGTMVIASLVVALALGGSRDDLLIPATDPANVVRDPDGKIVGVRAFRRG